MIISPAWEPWLWCIGGVCVADGGASIVNNADKLAVFIPHAIGAGMALYGAWKRYGKHRHRVVAYVKSRMKRFHMIKPTIGRKVWFYPSAHSFTDSGANEVFVTDPEQPLDATIVYVHSDTMLNLRVSDQNGGTHGVCSVPLIQDGPPPPGTGRYATWMPYQTGQAKLATETSAKLNEANAAAGGGAPLPAGTMVDSTDPARLQNNPPGGAPAGDNTMRHEYRILTPAEIQAVKDLKDQGLTLLQLIQSIGHSDELVAAQRYARQAVMWAVAHVTK